MFVVSTRCKLQKSSFFQNLVKETAILKLMNFHVELEQETDGRWIAEIPELPGVLVYGDTRDHATQKVQALALRVLADGLEQGSINASTFSFAS